MINYYLTYDKESFSEELLKTTKELGLCFCLEKILDYVKKVCYNYDINTPLITIKDKNKVMNEGIYLGYKKEIIFYGFPSLITLLHELRHHIQQETKIFDMELSYEDKEIEARAWSSSLFYSVFPETYLELAKQGQIKFI